ncbi:MAG: acetamidase/formamidase family protein [Acidimicrobiales bacterium]
MSGPVVLASTPESVRFGRLPGAGAVPVLDVGDGAVVSVETVSHEGILPDQGGDPVAFFAGLGIGESEVLDDARAIAAARLRRDPERDGPHVVTGPVAVRGARPGSLLRVETLGLERRAGYGIVSNRHGRGVLAGELPASSEAGMTPAVVSHLARVSADGRRGEIGDGSGRVLTFGLAPFLGLVGVAPADEGERSSTPPGRHGGNLDVRHLGAGSTLLLPIQADGALVYFGDPHFAQGNGEVALTAFEAPLTAVVRLSVDSSPRARVLAAALDHPFGETPDQLVAIGLGTTLDDAMAAAVRHALVLVIERTALAEPAALAFLSVAADFEVSQAVNGIRGVHCLIARADLDSVRDEPSWPLPYVGAGAGR